MPDYQGKEAFRVSLRKHVLGEIGIPDAQSLVAAGFASDTTHRPRCVPRAIDRDPELNVDAECCYTSGFSRLIEKVDFCKGR